MNRDRANNIDWIRLLENSDAIKTEYKNVKSIVNGNISKLKSVDGDDFVELLSDSVMAISSFENMLNILYFKTNSKTVNTILKKIKKKDFLQIVYDDQTIKDKLKNIAKNSSIDVKCFANDFIRSCLLYEKNCSATIAKKNSKKNNNINNNINNDMLIEFEKNIKSIATKHGKNTFYDLISSKDADFLKMLLKQVVKISSTKINVDEDVLLISVKKYSLKNSINCLFKMIEDIFDIYFQENKNNIGFGQSYDVCNNENAKVMSTVCIDIYDNTGLNIDPFFVEINNCTHNKNGNFFILGKYGDNVSYIDIIKIFRQMGILIHRSLSRFRYANVYDDNKVIFYEYFFEQILSEEVIIKHYFSKIIDKNDVLSIITSIKKNNILRIKHDCVLKIFDAYLQNSSEYYDNYNAVVAKYNSIQSIYYGDCNKTDYVPKHVVTRMILDAGLTYLSIENYLMVYNLHNFVKRNKIHMNVVLKSIFSETTKSLKDSIDAFMENNLCKSAVNVNSATSSVQEKFISKPKINMERLYDNIDCYTENY